MSITYSCFHLVKAVAKLLFFFDMGKFFRCFVLRFKVFCVILGHEIVFVYSFAYL